MNTKRIIFSILSLIALSSAAHGQTTMDSLKRYIWEYIEEGELPIANHYKDFTESAVTDTYEWLKEDGTPDWAMGTDVDTYPYYLMPLERFYGFDNSKVGRVRNGQVIVVKRYNTRGSSTFWIQSLTDRELVITSLAPDAPSITTRWRAVPRQTPPTTVPTGIDFTFTNKSSYDIDGLTVWLMGYVGDDYYSLIDSQPGSIPRNSPTRNYSGADIAAPAGTHITELTLEMAAAAANANFRAEDIRISVRVEGVSTQNDTALLDLNGGGSAMIPLTYASPLSVPNSGGKLKLHIEITDYYGY